MGNRVKERDLEIDEAVRKITSDVRGENKEKKNELKHGHRWKS